MDEKQFRDENLSHLFNQNNVIEIDSCICCAGGGAVLAYGAKRSPSLRFNAVFVALFL
jgi:hypothetical protein